MVNGSENATTVTVEIPATADTFTTSGQGDSNWVSEPSMRLGFNTDSGYGAERIYLYFDVSIIPKNSAISNAYIQMYQENFSPGDDEDMDSVVYYLTTSWDPNTLTWNNYYPLTESSSFTAIPPGTGWNEIGIPQIVDEWVSGQRPNYGFMIVGYEGDPSLPQRERMYTSLNANDGNHPRLFVEYELIDDTVPPVASVDVLPQFSPKPFAVRWSGTDDQSGIKWYDVQYRVNSGAWILWRNQVTSTSAEFDLSSTSNGDTIEFRARAVDNAINIQAWSDTPQATTTIDTVAPSTCSVGGECARLTIAKETSPPGGTDFPFIVDPGAYGYSRQWGAEGTDEGQFDYPFGIALDKASNVYVVDGNNYRIQKFDRTGKFILQWGNHGTDEGQFVGPIGATVDPVGNVFVVDTHNHRIQKFDSEGTFLAMWGSYGSGEGEFNFPFSVTVDSLGNVFVADSSNHRIQKFDSDGRFLSMWGWGVRDGSSAFQVCAVGCQAAIPGGSDGQLNDPRGIGVDTVGNVYVADTNNHRIQKFDNDAVFLAQWGTYGTREGQFRTPVDVSTDAAGSVYVTEFNNHRIQKFDTDGNFLLMWGWGVQDGDASLQTCSSSCQIGVFGNGDGQLYIPDELAVAKTGEVYVADAGNHRIQVFAPSLTTVLDDGESSSFFLAPDEYRISELVPYGWQIDHIDCGHGIVDQQPTIGVDLVDGDHVSCTFTNTRSPSACPIDDPGVGNEQTTLLGVGMGSARRTRMAAKVNVPDAADLVDLYGQMAAKERDGVRFARFIYPDRTRVIVRPATDVGDWSGVSWWGADLDEEKLDRRSYIKGRWTLKKGTRHLHVPRALVLYPTYQTATEYANAWTTFTAPGNFVSGSTNHNQLATQQLAIPVLQAQTDLTVEVAVTDVNRSPRSVELMVRAGGVEQTVTLTEPGGWKMHLLHLVELTLEDVPAGTDEVEFVLTSELGVGDSAALLGATAHYPCELPQE